MNVELNENLVQVIILDISGVYAQIHNQGYFDRVEIETIEQIYFNKQHWRVVIVDREVLSETN